MSFGSDLRSEREARNISLGEVALGTRFSERHLRALEADHYEELPGGVFNRGLVRSYCGQLGLDADHWMQQFVAQHADQAAERDWAAFAENVKNARVPTGAPRSRWWGVALLLLGVILLAWSAWHFVIRPHVFVHRAAVTGLAPTHAARNADAKQG